jgi:hypothetical protein
MKNKSNLTPIESKFLRFPIKLLPSLIFEKEEALKKMILYGVYEYAKRTIEKSIHNYKLEHILGDFIYKFHQKELTKSLNNKINVLIESGKFEPSVDYRSFFDGKIGEEEIVALYNIVEQDFTLKNEILDFWIIKQSAEFFNFDKMDIDSCISIGQECENLLVEKEPPTGLRIDIALDFLNNEKTEHEWIQLTAFLAVKTIMGGKGHCRIYKNTLLYRMLGFMQVSGVVLDKREIEFYNKYYPRYQYDKLKIELIYAWNLLFVGPNKPKGNYVGFKNKITAEKLMQIAYEKTAKGKREKTLKANDKVQTIKIFENDAGIKVGDIVQYKGKYYFVYLDERKNLKIYLDRPLKFTE